MNFWKSIREQASSEHINSSYKRIYKWLKSRKLISLCKITMQIEISLHFYLQIGSISKILSSNFWWDYWEIGTITSCLCNLLYILSFLCAFSWLHLHPFSQKLLLSWILYKVFLKVIQHILMNIYMCQILELCIFLLWVF